MLGGLKTEFPATGSMRVSGVDYTHDALIAKANVMLAPSQALAALRAQVKDAEAAATAAEPIARTWFDELQAALINYYGKTSSDLAGYGIALPKPKAPLTVEKKLQQITRMRETRALRGTKGSREKAAIKSVAVPSVTVGSTSTAGAAAAGSEPSSSTPSTAASK